MTRKQKGGKVLGQGGYGCAIAPAMSCSDKNDPKKLKNQVTKLIDMSRMDEEEKESLLEEFKISQKFKKVDPKNKYFLGGIENCKITNKHKSISKSDLKKCGITTKKEIPLMNIIMKKGKDFEKIAPKLNDKDLLKSLAHLLNGAKKAVYDLNLLLLDIKHLNILYVNSEEKENHIHPVFIDFGPDLIAQSKREFKVRLNDFDSFYSVWPLEMVLTMYMKTKKTPVMPMRNWKDHFDSKKEMMDVLKSNKEMDLEDFAKDIKDYIGFDIKRNRNEMISLVGQFKSDISSKYKTVADKIMVYEIANSFRHLPSKKLQKVLKQMLYPDYEQRLTIAQSLKKIEKEIGSVKEKDLLIPYKKLNVFQKFHRFMTKPVNIGQRGAGAMKKKGQSWDDYWAEERIKEAKRRYKVMVAQRKKCKCKGKCKCKNGGTGSKKIKKGRFLISSKPQIKRGRFLVSPTSSKPKPKPKKRPTVSFAETMSVVTIPKNDCPKINRPHLTKVSLTEAEKQSDIKHLGRARRKKYKLLCRDPKHSIYTKESGFKCCSNKRGGKCSSKCKNCKKK